MKNKLLTLVLCLATATVSAQGVPHILLDHTHATPGEGAARSVANVGDINQDGVEDFIIGITQAKSGGTAVGSAQVISGADDSTLYTFFGDPAGIFFGWSVEGAGDVNMDGVPDLIVGSPLSNGGMGDVRVFSGADGSQLYQYSSMANSLFGYDVAGVGDMNADGFDDFAVGAPQGQGPMGALGFVLIFSGVDGSVLWNLSGSGTQMGFGFAIAGVGDLLNDGSPDIAIGAPFDSHMGASTGSVIAYSGSTGMPLFSMLGTAAGDLFGCAVSQVGDADGDSFVDILVGAKQDGSAGPIGTGYHRVCSGFNGATINERHGENIGDQYGFSVSGAGDVDRDGTLDILVGAPFSKTGATISTGYMRACDGRFGFEKFVIRGSKVNEHVGYSLSDCGDVNNDNYADFILGSFGLTANSLTPGRAAIYSSAPSHIGSDKDFKMASGLNFNPTNGVDIKELTSADNLRIQLYSPLGQYYYRMAFLIAQIHTPGQPPQSPVGRPDIHFDPSLGAEYPFVILLDGSRSQYPTGYVRPAAITMDFIVPSYLIGFDILFQGLVIGPGIGDDAIVATNGHLMRVR